MLQFEVVYHKLDPLAGWDADPPLAVHVVVVALGVGGRGEGASLPDQVTATTGDACRRRRPVQAVSALLRRVELAAVEAASARAVSSCAWRVELAAVEAASARAVSSCAARRQCVAAQPTF